MNELAQWAHGYCSARHYPRPKQIASQWLHFLVGKPDQAARFIYCGSDVSEFAAMLGRISEPHIYATMLGVPENAASAIPEGWTFREAAYFMTHPGNIDRKAAPELDIRIKFDPGVRIECEALDDSGNHAARGVVGLSKETAVYDQIVTDPEHRRRGHGRRVVEALQLAAMRAGAKRHILIATPEGRALYHRMGWTTLSSTIAVISPSRT